MCPVLVAYLSCLRQLRLDAVLVAAAKLKKSNSVQKLMWVSISLVIKTFVGHIATITCGDHAFT